MMLWLLVVGVLSLMAAAALIAFIWVRESEPRAGDQGEEVPLDQLMGDQGDYLG